MSILGSRILRIISNILIVALLLTLLPQNAFAQPQDGPEDIELEYILEEHPDESETEVTRIGELTEQRERNKKFFLNSDHSISAEIHISSIHYLEEGTWEEIDNTIIEDETVPELPLRNKGNDMVLRFARQFTGTNKMVSIHASNNIIFISPADSSASRAEAGSTSASVLYRDVYPSIDFEYFACNDSLKENIIIHEFTGRNSFSFIIQTPQLTPELRELEIYFLDNNGDEVFVMPAPYMYDQTGEENFSFSVSLEEKPGPYHLLTYTADETWLRDSARVYPVIIDPTVWTTQSSSYTYTRDTFVDSKYPTNTYKWHEYLKSGRGVNTRGITRSYIMFPTLPEINAADEIISAELRMYQSWNLSEAVTVNLYQVTGAWDSGTLNWNNQPTFNSRVIDFDRCQSSDAWRVWSVTPVVKDWYRSAVNHGFLIKHADETERILDFISSDNSNSSLRPYLVITYRNQSGLEGYLSYTSMDLGRSGSASVNNYNGNLVYTHTDLSLSGSRIPLYISHVYNSDAKGNDIGYGRGWRLNLSQTIRSVTIQNMPYAEYTDGDGTIHYFLLHEGKYYLETPGIYLSLTKNADNTYTLKDSQDNEMKFNSSGNLVEIKNNQGDTLTVGYSGGKISTVTDGAGRVATLTYNSSNLLAKITDPSGRNITYTYSSSNLSTIKYPDNANTAFSYSVNKITKVTHPAGQNLRMTYFPDNDIQTLSHYGSDNVLSQSYTFNYWFNATTITDRNNKTTKYTFNHAGNPRNIVDSQGNAAYLNLKDNMIINEMPFRNTTINLLKNHNMERIEDWTLIHENSSSATGTYATGVSFHGSKSLLIEKTNSAGLSFYRQNLSLSKGKTFTFSAFLKTENVTNTGGGARLVIRYKNSAGNWVEEQSMPVVGSQDWQRLYLTFTVPADATTADVQAGLALEGATGMVWYDNAQLEAGSAPTSYNLVENSSFELDEDSNGIPDRWATVGASSKDILVTSQKYFDSRSFRIYGDSTVNKYFHQRIDVSGSKGDTFVISGWGKGKAVPRTDSKSTRRFGLSLRFYTGDTSTIIRQYFNEDYDGWQYLSELVQAPVDYDYVRIYGIYMLNSNIAYFDGFQLNKEPVSTYTYDSKGNVISANDPNNSRTNFTYNSNNDLVRAVDPKGGNFIYSYDAKHNLLSALSPAGSTYSFNYDSFGNITEASLGHVQNENLLKNGNFSDANQHWIQTAQNNTGIITVTDSALQLSGSAGQDSAHLSAYQETAVKPNTTYTLSGLVKTQLTEGTACYVVEEINSSNQVINTITDEYATLSETRDWTQRALTFKTRRDTARVRVYLRLANGEQDAPPPAALGSTVPGRYKTVTRSPARDTSVVSSSPSNNYGTATWLGVGKWADGKTYQSILGFTLPAEVVGKKVVEAKLYLYSAKSSSASPDTSSVAIYDVISSWTESTPTWNNFPSRSEPAELTWKCPGFTADGAENVVDITNIVQRWADQYTSSAYGIILRQTSSTNGTFKLFHSRQHTDPSLRPRLEIKYDTSDSYRIIGSSDDARVRDIYPTSNYGSSEFISTGYNPSINSTRAWFKFPVNSLPANARIDSAVAELIEYLSGYSIATSSEVSLHRALTTWNEGTLTWNTQPAYASTPSAAITIGAQTSFGIRQWEITDLVKGYHSNQYSNHGFVLVSQHKKYFNTKERADAFKCPRLRVEYTLDTDGPEVYYTPTITDDVSIALSFYDEVTGYKRHRYQWTATPDAPATWTAWSTAVNPQYTSPDSGTWYLHVQAEDQVGNITTSWAGPYSTQFTPSEFAWFDAIQLEEGNRISAYNLLENTSFENTTAGAPLGYVKVVEAGTPVFSTDTTTYQQGDKSAKVYAVAASRGYLDIDQNISLKPNTMYTISFWVKGSGLTSNSTVAAAYCTDAQGQNLTKLFEYKTGGTFEWHNVTKTFTTPATGECLSNLRLGMITSSKGSIWFDAVTLKEGGSVVTAEYTSDGNYLQSTTDATGIVTATYNYTTDGLKTGEMSSVTDAAGNTQSYTYDILSRVTGVTDNTSGIGQSYVYNNLDSLQRIIRQDFDYVFTYDSLGRMTKVQTDKAGVQNTLVTHAYNANTGTLASSTFGNGQVLEYAYDALDRLQGVKYDNSTKFTYDYDARGNIVKVTDNVNDITTYYTYDLADRMLSFRESTGRYVTYDYDENNNATSLKEVIDGIAYTTSFSYNEDNSLKSITINSGVSFEYYFDEKGLPNRSITTLNSGYKLFTQYIYNQRGLLENYQQDKESYTYEFDTLGNITKITAGSGDQASYTYDSLNQLTSEIIIENGITRTISYIYDSHGNMISRVEGNKETVYTYDLDRLVQIEEKTDGVVASIQTLSYDNAGNLITDGEFTYTWQMGRQLQGITGTDLNTSYIYNENGLRTKKTVNGQTHEYTLLGSSVTREVIRDNTGNILWTIHYSYAGEGTPVSMNVNGTEYYYLKNAQGDITHIVDEDGNEVAAYEYDAWGNHLSITGGDIAQLNPYRYRGYRYDSETGLYYLQSRYYNPEWGRFINGDILLGDGTMANLYRYCNCNPVNYNDSDGYLPRWLNNAIKIGSLACPLLKIIDFASTAIDLSGHYKQQKQDSFNHTKNIINIGAGITDNLAPVRGITGLGNDEKYVKHCQNLYNHTLSRVDYMADRNVPSVVGKTWDDLSKKEQELISRAMPSWDSEVFKFLNDRKTRYASYIVQKSLYWDYGWKEKEFINFQLTIHVPQ